MSERSKTGVDLDYDWAGIIAHWEVHGPRGVTLEHMYQAFKARLMKELVVADAMNWRNDNSGEAREMFHSLVERNER